MSFGGEGFWVELSCGQLIKAAPDTFWLQLDNVGDDSLVSEVSFIDCVFSYEIMNDSCRWLTKL